MNDVCEPAVVLRHFSPAILEDVPEQLSIYMDPIKAFRSSLPAPGIRFVIQAGRRFVSLVRPKLICILLMDITGPKIPVGDVIGAKLLVLLDEFDRPDFRPLVFAQPFNPNTLDPFRSRRKRRGSKIGEMPLLQMHAYLT
jgi:hypothetical protein